MDTLKPFIDQLPTLVMTFINQKFQLMDKTFNGNVFTSRNSLGQINSHKQSFFFNIYLKQKTSEVLSFQAGPTNKSKGMIEQIELQIQVDPEFASEINKTLSTSKMHSLQKLLLNFIMNSPLFSFLFQMNYPEIQPSDFEATLTFQQEINRNFLDETWIRDLKIEKYNISIGLFTVPSKAVSDLVKEYLTALDTTSDLRDYLKNSQDEENEYNKSWDKILEPCDFQIETQKEKIDNISQESSTIQITNQPIVTQKYIMAMKKKEKSKEEEGVENPSITENLIPKGEKVGDKKEKDDFLVKLFEHTEELRKYVEQKSYPESDIIGNILMREKEFYEELKNSI